jgi:hypothetical protein
MGDCLSSSTGESDPYIFQGDVLNGRLGVSDNRCRSQIVWLAELWTVKRIAKIGPSSGDFHIKISKNNVPDSAWRDLRIAMPETNKERISGVNRSDVLNQDILQVSAVD